MYSRTPSSCRLSGNAAKHIPRAGADMADDLVLGIDIGGSGIKAALADLSTGQLATARKRLKTPQPATPEAVAQTVRELLRDEELRGAHIAGAGFPAVIKSGVARTAANVDKKWIGTNVAALLAEATGMPTYVGNDADVAGLAEIRYGAGKDVQGVVLMLTLGTGIGSAIFHDLILLPNTELGHLELDGKDAERTAAASVKDRKKLSWKKYAKRLDAYLDLVERALWPDLIILGGGISKEPDKFVPRLHTRAPVVAASMGNNAGIVGAALYAAECDGLKGYQIRPVANGKIPAW